MGDLCLPDPLRQMYEELTCPLCSELYTDPYIFTGCSHAFCRACVLEKLEGKGITKMECPTCRQPGWKKDLVPNHKYQNLANILRLWTLEDGRSLTAVMHSHYRKSVRASAARDKAAEQTASESTMRRVQSRKAAAFKVPRSIPPDGKDAEVAMPKAGKQVPPQKSADGPGTSAESAGARDSSPATGLENTRQSSAHSAKDISSRGQRDTGAGTGQQQNPAVSAPATGSASRAAAQAVAADIHPGQAAPELPGNKGKSEAGTLNLAPGSGVKGRQRVVGRRGRGTPKPRTSSRFAAMAASTEKPAGNMETTDCPKSTAMTKAPAKVSTPRVGNGGAEGAESAAKPGQIKQGQESVLASAKESDGKRRRSEAEEMCYKDAPAAGQATREARIHKGEKENTLQAQQGLPSIGKSGKTRKEAPAKQRAQGSMSSAAATGTVLERNPQGGAWVRGFFSEVGQAAEPTQLDPLLVAKEQSRAAVEPIAHLATTEALSNFGPEWAAQARSQQALDQMRGNPAALAGKLEEARALQEAMSLCERMLQQHRELPGSAVLVGTDRSMTQIDAHCNELGIRFSESSV